MAAPGRLPSFAGEVALPGLASGTGPVAAGVAADFAPVGWAPAGGAAAATAGFPAAAGVVAGAGAGSVAGQS